MEQTVEQFLLHARRLQREGDLSGALRAYQQAQRVDDLDPDVHDGLGTANYLLGNLDLAAEHFERVTRLDPRRGTAWINLGAIYNRLREHGKAVEVLRRAVQVERNSGAAFFTLGSAYRNLRQWALAIPAYREAIRLEPKEADAYVQLGMVYLEQKNIPQATAQFKKALDLRPESKRAKEGLVRCEAANREVISSDSPFGRLVSSEMLRHGQEAQVVSQRRLTDAERLRDRQALVRLCGQLATQGGDLLQLVEAPLATALVNLAKGLTLADRRERDAALSNSLDELVVGRQEFAPRVLALRRTMQQLRDHEEAFQ
ncbi:MAG: tetratricopeptide repeat protein [Planctomycetaceae bacterium]